jgi:anti-sigma B factor antagonist
MCRMTVGCCVGTRLLGRDFIVSLGGELERTTVGGLSPTMTELPANCERVILDLRGVSFLDAAGLRLIEDAREHLATRGIAFEVMRGPSPVMRTIRKAGIPVRLTSADESTPD